MWRNFSCSLGCDDVVVVLVVTVIVVVVIAIVLVVNIIASSVILLRFPMLPMSWHGDEMQRQGVRTNGA